MRNNILVAEILGDILHFPFGLIASFTKIGHGSFFASILP